MDSGSDSGRTGAVGNRVENVKLLEWRRVRGKCLGRLLKHSESEFENQIDRLPSDFRTSWERFDRMAEENFRMLPRWRWQNYRSQGSGLSAQSAYKVAFAATVQLRRLTTMLGCAALVILSPPNPMFVGVRKVPTASLKALM